MKLLTAAVIACISLPSHSAWLELDDAGNFEDMAVTNDIFYGIADGYDIGGNLFATSLVDLTFTYLGHEAGYNNEFNAYGQNLNNKSNSVGDSFTESNVTAGLLDFDFYANNITSGISNGENEGFMSSQSFATILDFTFNGVFYDAILLFDDSGAGPDDNHDDHIIGIQAAAVPEPSILALFGLGLFGLGFAHRRKN